MIRGGLVTLHVKDVGRAVRFYVETLGMKLVEDGGESSAVIDAGDAFLIELRRGEGPASVVTLFAKGPLAEAIAIFENRGIAFVKAGDAVTFEDVDGNTLALRAVG